ncbi:MAG TPA: hypothetical protein VHA52_00955 [Candidatus Babeliaceae bacterium]|nr:hypothetical protein [Candidatus Babeliaceae bacterium]
MRTTNFTIKKLLLLVAVIVFSSHLYAQDSSGKLSLEVVAGPAVPLGTFASKDTSFKPASSGEVAGWAKTGVAINVSVDYRVTSKIGVSLLAGWQQNVRDKAPLEKQLKGGNNEGRNIRAVIDKEYWRVGKMMLGGFFETPTSTSGKLDFQSKILIGASKTAIPGYNYSVILLPSNDLSTAAKGGKISLPWAFCYQVNIGLKYFLSNKLSLLAQLDYFGAMPIHKYKYYSSFPVQIEGKPVEKKYSVSTVSPMLGISFTF